MNLKQSLQELERKYMPQVAQNDLPVALSLLKGNGVKVSIETVSPSDLKHSQRAVDKKKVLSIIKDLKSGKILPPLVISLDNYIVDGHHRWIAYKLLKMPIKCIKIHLPQKEAIIEFKKIESQIK